jgi:hypothetical protein
MLHHGYIAERPPVEATQVESAQSSILGSIFSTSLFLYPFIDDSSDQYGRKVPFKDLLPVMAPRHSRGFYGSSHCYDP